MRLARASALAIAAALVLSGAHSLAFQGRGGNQDRVVPGGGVLVTGWKGRIAVSDTSSLTQGRTINDSKFAMDGANLKIEAGPAGIYWNPAHTATGDYTVKGTFTETGYMTINNHPHSYGIFIGGNKLETEQMNLLYCVTYGDGKALIRGMGPAAFNLLRDPVANPAVNKAAGPNAPVTNEISWTVKAGRAECSVNGKVIAGYDQAQMVGAGKLDSTNGTFGIRVSHNVDVAVAGFGLVK